jgi:predicted dehydrogenase
MSSNRRKFLKQLGGTAALLSTGSLISKSNASPEQRLQFMTAPEKKYSANDTIRIAGIGMGIQGYHDVDAALKTAGVEMVACCDLYSGRLQRAKEVYGNHVFTTRRYEDILERKDVDAVIIATNDSWHSRIAIDALKKGKAVYLEKPMIQHISEGWNIVRAQQQSKKILQVGSQGVSSLGFAKAKELYEAGEIGTINSVEAVNNRQSHLGAWKYTIPLDASPETVDWQRYQMHAKTKRDFDAKRFFWWRNYREYGTGMAGDLFVHMLSGLHFITSSKGPSKIYSTGALTYWKDGRDMPDQMLAVLDYPAVAAHPAFQVSLKVNFVSGEGESGYTKIIGSDGVIQISENRVTVKRRKMPKAPSIGGWDALFTYPNDMQQRLREEHNRKYSREDQQAQVLPDISYAAPEGYSAHVAHLGNFIDSVRTGKPVVEDAVFGFRAAAPCLACNDSYFQNKVIKWDAEKMKLL